MRGLFFVIVVGLVLAALATVLFRYGRRSRRQSEATWEDLLAQLAGVDREKIQAIALDAMPSSDRDAYAMDAGDIWDLLGGMEGLELLERNCQVLVQLAMYVQRWHPEALVAAEQLRLNAREIEWHVGRLKGAAGTGNLQSAFATYAQRAAATYYLMTRHVLELYEQANFPELDRLQQAI